jgi:hypothetical protein
VQCGAKRDLGLGIGPPDRAHVTGTPVTNRDWPLTIGGLTCVRFGHFRHTVSSLKAEPFAILARDTGRWSLAAHSHVATQEGPR